MNEEDRVIVMTGRTDIRAGEEFTSEGRTYVAVTNPVGAVREFAPGVAIGIGMLNDPLAPMPVGAICAIPKED